MERKLFFDPPFNKEFDKTYQFHHKMNPLLSAFIVACAIAIVVFSLKWALKEDDSNALEAIVDSEKADFSGAGFDSSTPVAAETTITNEENGENDMTGAAEENEVEADEVQGAPLGAAGEDDVQGAPLGVQIPVKNGGPVSTMPMRNAMEEELVAAAAAKPDPYTAFD